MHIILELPTIKKSQDFNQTIHARPQHPIVFIHNISLYFNCISNCKICFQMVMSWSHHAFFCGMTKAV